MAPTYFSLRPSSGSLQLSLAKIILILIYSVRLRCNLLCGGVAAFRGTPLPDYRPATSWVHYITRCNTQSSAPEDGRNNCPKLVELIWIINKPLLLNVVGCLYYLYYLFIIAQFDEFHNNIIGLLSQMWLLSSKSRLTETRDRFFRIISPLSSVPFMFIFFLFISTSQ